MGKESKQAFCRRNTDGPKAHKKVADLSSKEGTDFEQARRKWGI